MFKVEIKNLSISANLGITELERKKKQLLKVTLSFDYKVKEDLFCDNFHQTLQGNIQIANNINKIIDLILKK